MDLVMSCGCKVEANDQNCLYEHSTIVYCPRHGAADPLYEALQGLGVPRLAADCFCQHIDTVEHTDECKAARAALALADGKTFRMKFRLAFTDSDKDGG